MKKRSTQRGNTAYEHRMRVLEPAGVLRIKLGAVIRMA